MKKREIKFRAKEKYSGKWVYGYYVYSEEFDTDFIMTGKVNIFDFLHEIQVQGDTVGEFTGLKDMNGNEIYEGDVIQLINSDGEKIRAICEFGTARRLISKNEVDITGFYFKLSNGRKTFPIADNYCGKHDLEISEVIGNIHDKADLTRGAEDVI